MNVDDGLRMSDGSNKIETIESLAIKHAMTSAMSRACSNHKVSFRLEIRF